MSRRTGKKLAAFAMLVSLCVACLGCMHIKDYIEEGYPNTAQSSWVNDKAEMVEPEEYYSTNAKIIERIDVAQSESIHTESQAIAFFAERGFTQYAVITDFTIEGDVLPSLEVSSESEDKHPVYITYYVSNTGEFWTVIDMNGRIFANAVSYSMNSEKEQQTILSESNTVISFDGMHNRYYETIPTGDTVRVIQVKRIDAQILDGLTAEELDRR